MSREDVKIDMICTDIDGDKCVIVGFADHKRCEVAFIGYHGEPVFEGDTVRIDELEPTGETWAH